MSYLKQYNGTISFITKKDIVSHLVSTVPETIATALHALLADQPGFFEPEGKGNDIKQAKLSSYVNKARLFNRVVTSALELCFRDIVLYTGHISIIYALHS